MLFGFFWPRSRNVSRGFTRGGLDGWGFGRCGNCARQTCWSTTKTNVDQRTGRVEVDVNTRARSKWPATTDSIMNRDLASSHGDHEDDRGVDAGTQRRPMPLCPAERSSQPGEKRQGRDRVDRREERSEIFADLDEQGRHENMGDSLIQR